MNSILPLINAGLFAVGLFAVSLGFRFLADLSGAASWSPAEDPDVADQEDRDVFFAALDASLARGQL